MTTRGERVLVTGAGGFIGSHLVAALVLEHSSVVALDLDLRRLSQLTELPRESRIEGDLGDPEVQRRSLDGVTTVFHLGAAHLDLTVPASEYWRTNVEAVSSLAEASSRAGVSRFIHCSTVGVYGRIDQPPADEHTPCRPRNSYEKTKLAGEEALLEVAAKTDLDALILRPAWVYGPGCARTHRLFAAIRRRRFVMAGDGHNLRHCLYIRDMVTALRLATKADVPAGEIIVLGDERANTVRTLVEQIAELTRAPMPVSVPRPLIGLAAAAIEALYRPLQRHPPLSRRSLAFFDSNTSFDTSLSRQLLDFSPAVDLEGGLSETWRFIDRGTAAEKFDVRRFWTSESSEQIEPPRSNTV